MAVRARGTRPRVLSEALRRARDGAELVLAREDAPDQTITLTVVRSMRARMRGYLAAGADRGRDGILLAHTTSVHTAFMRFALDVVHLSADGEVLALSRHLPPWRVGPVARRTRHIVELPSDRSLAGSLAVGDRLTVAAPTPRPGASA